jgi:hypothetical protein
VPRINKEYYPVLEVYKTLLQECTQSGDKDACAVIAACAVSEQPFKKVQALFRELGRPDGKGTHTLVTIAAMERLGYKMVPVPSRFFIDQYPELHKRALKSVTAHHPDRFPHAFRNGCSYLMSTGDHLLAVVNGEVRDHMRGSRKKIKNIWECVKLSAEAK